MKDFRKKCNNEKNYRTLYREFTVLVEKPFFISFMALYFS